MKTFSPSLLFLVCLPAWAHMEPEKLDGIEVVTHNEGQSLVDFVPSFTQIRGKELQKRRQTSLGDTLQSEAGVNSTSFGPSASRPVIRGLDGDRIKILQNGLGTLDASTQSLDHAVPVDMLTVDQIEVVRGPMGLLYGSSAVGGVVNLLTNRIHSVYEEGFFSQGLVQGESVNKGISSALHLNYGAKKWMFHADGSSRNLADTKLPAHARGGEGQEKGKLPNSFNQQDNVAVGASKIMDRGYAGGSFNHFNTVYGSVAEKDVSIDMTQNRGEFHGEWRPEGSRFRKFQLKSAQSNYVHREIEDGVTGTTFRNDGNETRFEAMNESGSLKGVSGLQTQFFKFSAKGDEAFLPTSDNFKTALFVFQENEFSERHSASVSARAEVVQVNKRESSFMGPADDRGFIPLSGSLGHQYRLSKGDTLSSSVSYTERAPNFQELYARGDHLANGSYEAGSSTLTKEKAYALDLSFKAKRPEGQFVVSAYAQVFKDYISLNPTGDSGNSPENLPEFRYEQIGALFYGGDMELRREVAEVKKGVVTLISTADFVRAKNTDSGGNLPRISPPRVSAGLEYSQDKWNADVELQYVAHQTKTADNEKWTDSYAMTNFGVAYNLTGETWGMSVFGRVRNVFDVEARNHISTLKEIAPLPGRNFILGLQAQI